jgi:hypothetical protein
MQDLIPLYSSEGELCDRIGLKRLDRLARLDLVKVVRSRNGKPRRAILLRRPGDPKPCRLTDYVGTRYSYLEHLDNGHLAWGLKSLGKGDDLRTIFLQVVLDCATPAV